MTHPRDRRSLAREPATSGGARSGPGTSRTCCRRGSPRWTSRSPPPVREALARGDRARRLRLPASRSAGLGDAFAGFAGGGSAGGRPRAGDARCPTSSPGSRELHRALLTEPGDGVVINPPVYHPFFPRHRAGRPPRRRGAARARAAARELDLDALDRAFAAGAGRYMLCNPHNPTGRVLARDELERGRRARGAPRRAGCSPTRSTRRSRSPAPTHVPFLTRRRRRGRARDRAHAALEGLEPRRPQVRRRRLRLGEAAPRSRRAPAEHRLHAATSACSPRSPRSRGRRVARRADRATSTPTGASSPSCSARAPARGPLRACRRPGYLAWLDCRELGLGDDPAAAFLERGRVALSSGPELRARRRGLRAAELRHLAARCSSSRRADGRGGGPVTEPRIDPVDELAGPWWEALVAARGPFELFDAHTHFGRNDPDGYKQEPAELLAGARPGAVARRRLPDARARRLPGGQRPRDRGRGRVRRPSSSPTAASTPTTAPWPRPSAPWTRAPAGSSSTRAPSASRSTTGRPRPRRDRRRAPAAGADPRRAGHPGARPPLARARERVLRRPPDPRPRRGLRPRLALAGDARRTPTC